MALHYEAPVRLLPWVAKPAYLQVFQTEYNQVIDVSECPVPYIRHETPQHAILTTLQGCYQHVSP